MFESCGCSLGFLVVADDVANEKLERQVPLRPVKQDVEANSMLKLFCTARPVRFYASSPYQGSWSLSRNCINRISVYQVDGPLSVNENPALINADHQGL